MPIETNVFTFTINLPFEKWAVIYHSKKVRNE